MAAPLMAAITGWCKSPISSITSWSRSAARWAMVDRVSPLM